MQEKSLQQGQDLWPVFMRINSTFLVAIPGNMVSISMIYIVSILSTILGLKSIQKHLPHLQESITHLLFVRVLALFLEVQMVKEDLMIFTNLISLH